VTTVFRRTTHCKSGRFVLRHEDGKPQPIGLDDKPDFDDFGLGCFLLAGSEVWRLSGG
jgi:hypothetical protein